MKNNKGISIIELVIVMIIIIMIAGFAVYNGRSSIQKAEATEIFSEISSIKSAISGVIVQMNLEGKEEDEDWLSNFYDTSGETDGKVWYEIYGMDKGNAYEASNVKNKLGMEDIKRSYKVTFDTGKVELSNPIQLFGRTIQTYEDIRELVESNKI